MFWSKTNFFGLGCRSFIGISVKPKFVRLKDKNKLNDAIKEKIKKEIRGSLSPKHVPSKIIQVYDIPKTKSGKIVELAIKKTIHKEHVENLSSIANPEALNDYKNIVELNY